MTVEKNGWMSCLQNAVAKCQSQLYEAYGEIVKNLQFEHVDASGYWFTFELVNDPRRQTYAVRHSDMK